MYKMYFLLKKNHYRQDISSEEEFIATWEATWKTRLNVK